MFDELFLAISRGSSYLLEKATKTAYTDWTSILTDIIAVSAALGALALPISLNVIEATRNRYRSPSLLMIYHRISEVDPQKLNRSLFSFLSFAILFKLIFLSNYIETQYLIPPLLAATLLFTGTISDLFRHLHFTYKLMSDISEIKSELIDAICLGTNSPSIVIDKKSELKHPIKLTRNFFYIRKIKRLSKSPESLIPTVLEIEAYELVSDHSKIQIDQRIQSLAYEHLKRLPAEESKLFLTQLLNSTPRLLAEIENTRELDVYQEAAGLYLYILPRALFKCEKFSQHFFEAERIARYREKALPPYGRFFRNGRIFLNCFLDKGSIFVYRALFAHFKSLAWNAVYTMPDDFPSLIEHANQMVSWSFRDQGQGWNLPQAVPELWSYPKIRELASDVDNNYSGIITYEKLKENFDTIYVPEMNVYLAENCHPSELLEKQQKLESTLISLWNEVGLKEISNGMEIETLNMLGVILATSPEIFIDCRELKNPAGAGAINVGGSPVPSSIESCVKALVHEKNFAERFHSNDTLEFKIVDAIGALIIYELWRTRIFEAPGRARETTTQPIPIPNAKIRELKAASKRAVTLENSFNKTLSNKAFTDRIGLLKDQVEELKAICKDFSVELKNSLEVSVERAITKQPLSKNELDRFLSEFFKDIETHKQEVPLLAYIRLADPKPYSITVPYPREAFLENTDIHYVFNGLGRTLTNYHDWMCAQILFRTSSSIETSSPAPFGELILISKNGKSELENMGFSFHGDSLHWPQNRYKSKYHFINIDQNKYFQLSRQDHPVNVAIKYKNTPITIEMTEENGKVIHKISYYIALHQSYLERIV
ncbi:MULTISPECIES: hypothetical protein [unclassified Pseudomonas]|uniref:hypothetical protein n=1 Tax=unclassified Pseudomonas TaxID=196821 RepID=UPI000AE0D3E2|nr:MULTISPECIES: hypothetical protein [unclassified Pseudomonas]